MFGWISNGAGFCIIPPQLIAGIIAFYNPDYTPTAWHIFLMFQASNIVWMCYNIFLIKRTNWIHDVGCKFERQKMLRALLTFGSRILHRWIFRHSHHLPRSFIFIPIK